MKFMKKVLIVILVVSIFSGCKFIDEEKDITRISGEIANHRNEKIVVAYNSVSDTVQINDEGFFTITVDLEKPAYIYLSSNFNNLVLYLIKGTKIDFTADFNDFNNSVKFQGDLIKINEYLNKQNITINNTAFNSAEFLYASEPEVFENSFNKFNDELNSDLMRFNESYLSKYEKFIEFEEYRLKYMSLSLLLQYHNNIKEEAHEDLNYLINEHTANIELNNPDLIMIWEYRNFLPQYVNYKFVKKVSEEETKIATVAEYASALFEIIEEEFNNDLILEELYFVFLDELTSNYGVNDMHDYFERYKNLNTDKNKLKIIEDSFNIWNRLSEGQPSVDFSFPDINGNIYKLNDFKGKYVYIDVWATWCGPCRIEMPHLKRLKENFKNKNIEIIGISVDERKSDWENFINRENLGGVQLYAGGWNNELVQHFMITGIPRFILLDKDGKIISANAERPSGKIEEILNELEGI